MAVVALASWAAKQGNGFATDEILSLIHIFSTGVGSTDMAAGMATGMAWFKVPSAIKFVLKGKFGPRVSGKDLILQDVYKRQSLACRNRSRTLDAPMPTNISTNSEPEMEKNGTLDSPATALALSLIHILC